MPLRIIRGRVDALSEANSGKRIRPELNSSDLRQFVVAHSGQSSQLFTDTVGRNTQFPATIEKVLQCGEAGPAVEMI